MFCYQCEQTAQGTGCTKFGVCGKDPKTAALQDLLVYVVKGISMYAHRARQLGAKDTDVDRFTIEALFSTVTNVNFDADRLREMLVNAVEMRTKAKDLYEQTCKESGNTPESLAGPAAWVLETDMDTLAGQGVAVSIEKRFSKLGEDIVGLQELIVYGIKGMAAYAGHAMILGYEDEDVYAYIHEGMDFLTKESPTVDELLAMALKCGEVNLKVMELLDSANTGEYGNPVPVPVRMTPVKGKAILVSGHDLKDLEELLKQTEGKDINIYTHGEMLPAHGYPELKKYSHLAGHYGGAWMDQRKEFDEFPGSILMTTNCIQKPKETYAGRIFTCGLVGWPNVVHIQNRDFTPLIDAALEAEGFTKDAPEKTHTVGFGHHAVLGVADKVIEAVKQNKIKHFFLIGGCDGVEKERSYYTELAESAPEDSVILTLGCGKYRVLNANVSGEIEGIPRVLDMGQCNDAYSAIKVAQALADAFETDVNGLPLSLAISWFEQKAVCILLSLFYLGVQNIRLGPNLPAFITPNVLNVLVEKFNTMPVTNAEDDLNTIFNAKTENAA